MNTVDRVGTMLEKFWSGGEKPMQEEALVSMLVDVRRLCDQRGWDFQSAAERSDDLYGAEAGAKPRAKRAAKRRAKREPLGFGFVFLEPPRSASLAERDVFAELEALGARYGLEFVADGKKTVGKLLGAPGWKLAYGGLPVGELRSNALLARDVRLTYSGIPDLLVTADGTRAPLSRLGGALWANTVRDALARASNNTVVIGADVYRVA